MIVIIEQLFFSQNSQKPFHEWPLAKQLGGFAIMLHP